MFVFQSMKDTALLQDRTYNNTCVQFAEILNGTRQQFVKFVVIDSNATYPITALATDQCKNYFKIYSYTMVIDYIKTPRHTENKDQFPVYTCLSCST